MKLNEQLGRIKKMMGLLNEQQSSNDGLYDLKDNVYNGKVTSKSGTLEFNMVMSKSNLSFESVLSDGSSLEEIITYFMDSNSSLKPVPQLSPYLISSRVTIPPNYTKLLDFIKPIEEELKSQNFYCKFEEFGTGYVRVNIGVIGEQPIQSSNQAYEDAENNLLKNNTKSKTNVVSTPTQNQNTNVTTNTQKTDTQNQTTTQNQNTNVTTNTPTATTQNQNTNVTTNTPATTTQNQTTTPKGQEKIVTNFDKAYDYKMDDKGNFFFKGKPNTTASKTYPDWTPPRNQNALNAIKTKVFKQQ